MIEVEEKQRYKTEDVYRFNMKKREKEIHDQLVFGAQEKRNKESNF